MDFCMTKCELCQCNCHDEARKMYDLKNEELWVCNECYENLLDEECENG